MIELQHDNDYLATLLDIMNTVAGVPKPQTIALRALDLLIARTIVRAGGIWLNDNGNLVPLALYALDQQPILGAISGVIANNAPEFSTMTTRLGDQTGHAVSALAILPLQADTTCIGAIAIITPTPPTPRERLALQAIAAHLSLAIEHARTRQLAERQHNQLEAPDREWDNFLSHATHEIKNPLASIKGYADLLLRRTAKDPADPARKGLMIISQQVARTTALIEQLSDISRIGAGRLQIDRHGADLAKIIRQTVQEYRDAADQHQITLDDADAALAGHFDAARMHQVIGAMLSNAVKFSPNGGVIAVRVQRTQASPAPEVILSVSDHGIGVPVGEQERVFERFFRGSNVRGTFAGMGVGLFIARTIVALHGGRMWLESQMGQGTACFAVLPLL